MKQRAALALLMVAAALPLAISAQLSPPAACPGGEAAPAALLGGVHEAQRNVGVGAALSVGGRLAYTAFLGQADLEHGVPVGPATLFGAASVTKVITAVAVLRLWSEGRLDLDAPVQRYVPSFPARDEGVITPRLLATHRSGLPHPDDRTPELFATHYGQATDALEVFRDVALVRAPGVERVYSSSNYNLLAAVVEAITAERFQDWVTAHVLVPAGMADSRFDDVRVVIPNRSRRYTFYDPWTGQESPGLLRVPDWDYSFNVGGGGLLATAPDLARLGERLLEPGLLTPPAHGLLFSDDWFGRLGPDGERWLLVTGANPGVQAALAVLPRRMAAGAVLANSWGVGSRSGEMVRLARRMVDACLGDRPRGGRAPGGRGEQSAHARRPPRP